MVTILFVKRICSLLYLLPLLAISEAKPPNILIVVADDYGWNDIGYHGSEIKTPTLDKLASEGVKLENYYVQPICTPTRSQLLSGRYQIHTGLQNGVITPLQPNCLPTEIPTFADKLKQLGYATHMVGKWHLGFYKTECLPTNRGFDSFYGYLTGAEDYYQHNRCLGKDCGLDFHDNLVPVTNMNGTYSAYAFSSRVEQIVDRHAQTMADKPLLMYMPFQSVHAPLQVPEEYTKQYSFIKNIRRRTYAGMVSAMDEAVANITAAFKRNGLWDNTLMIFTTDNGGQVHAGGNNYPLKGWKGSLWEGGIRGVGFVHGNILNSTGVKNTELIHVSDWFPTILTLAGGQTKALSLDGYNVWDAINNGGKSPRHELLHNINPDAVLRGKPLYNDTFDTRIRAAIRYGDWKLLTGNPGISAAKHVKPPASDDEVASAPCVNPYDDIDPYATCNNQPSHTNDIASYDRDSNFFQNQAEVLKYNYYEDKNKNIWLYNIRTDPGEYDDVSDKYPSIVRKLLDRLAYYNSTSVPCRYPPLDNRGDPKYNGGVWGPWVK